MEDDEHGAGGAVRVGQGERQDVEVGVGGPGHLGHLGVAPERRFDRLAQLRHVFRRPRPRGEQPAVGEEHGEPEQAAVSAEVGGE